MSIYKTIAFRQLRAKHSFGFISFTTLLSVIGLMLGVAFLIIISAFSSGFSSAVEQKLSNIDGHLRIQKYNGFETIEESEIVYIDSLLNTFPHFTFITPYIKKNAMVRSGDITEGIMVYGVTENSLRDIFELEQFIIEGQSLFPNSNSIIIGTELAQQLNVSEGENVVLFDIEKLISDNLVIAEKLNISGIIKTGFQEYDKLLAFVPLEICNSLFGNNNEYDGVICNFSNPEQISKIDKEIIGKIDLSYSTSTWKERHSILFEWLNIYDIPILLLMFFIVLVAVFNISATLWMIVVEKSKNIGILLTLGFSRSKIRKVFLLKGLLVGSIGSILGLLLAITILILQVKFRFITLSSDIYFVEYLPVNMCYQTFILYPFCAIALTLLASLVPCVKASNVNPAEAVRYE